MKNFKIITIGLITAMARNISASDDTSLVNNYADDAVVQVQSNQDDAVNQALQDAGLANDVQVQAVTSENKPAEETKNVAATDTHVEPAPNTPTPSMQPPLTIHATDLMKPEVLATPIAHVISTATPTPVLPVAPVPAPVIAHIEEIKPVPIATSAVTPAATTPEQVKIVKVYPVLDAVRLAIKNVKNAAQDMFNYVYNFMTKPTPTKKEETPAPKEEIKTESVVAKTDEIKQLTPEVKA